MFQATLHIYIQAISLLIAIFLYRRIKSTSLVYFIPFLSITVLVEIIGYWCIVKGIKNYWIYNIFTTLEFCFYSYIFYQNLRKKLFKQIVAWFVPLYTIAVAANLIFLQGTQSFHTYTVLLGSFFIVVFCCFFFFETIQPETISLKLSQQPFFWVCTGLLVYYLGSVIINALFEYLRSNDLQQEGKKIYGTINRSLILILYTSFSVSFFLCRNNRKTYSSPS